MLADAQFEQFQSEGYVVVENVLDEAAMAAVRAECVTLLDGLFAGWISKERPPSASTGGAVKTRR